MLSISVGLSNRLKLFYLAADKIAEVVPPTVVLADTVKVIGERNHEEERRKTGNWNHIESNPLYIWLSYRLFRLLFFHWISLNLNAIILHLFI